MTSEFFKNWRTIIFLGGTVVIFLNFILGEFVPNLWKLTPCGQMEKLFGNPGFMPCDPLTFQYYVGYAIGVICIVLGAILIIVKFTSDKFSKHV